MGIGIAAGSGCSFWAVLKVGASEDDQRGGGGALLPNRCSFWAVLKVGASEDDQRGGGGALLPNSGSWGASAGYCKGISSV
eukprot:jgi/Tetstr1/447144/TSEL_034581.t1